jgi:2-keto-4-pentenoate hydratase
MPNSTLAFTEALLHARRSGQTIADSAGAPETKEAALHVQRKVMDALGETIGGWKVNLHPDFGGLAAPVFAGVTKVAPASWPLAERLMVEVEIAVRLKRDLPPGSYSRAEILAAIESMSLGVELCLSRLPAGNTLPFWVNLSDNIANEGYVISETRFPLAEIDFAALPCVITLDGETLYNAPAKHPTEDFLLPVIAYANAQSGIVGGLKAGQYITTGSLCGMVPVTRKGALRASLGRFGDIAVTLA